MGAAGTLTALPETNDRTASAQSPNDPQWHAVDTENGCSVAGLAGTLRTVEHGRQSLLSVAQSGDLGPDPCCAASAGAGTGQGRLDRPLRG